MPFPGHAQKGLSNGAAIFQEQCSGCHGPDGKAQTDMGKKMQAADLTSDEIQQQSDSKLAGIVKSGQKKMPAFNGKLSDDEIKAVVAYVKEFGKGK
jgi:mono/diheme cytochrome c family protein